MIVNCLALLAFGLFVNQISCHPDVYTPEFQAQLEQSRAASDSEYPPILSWHIHIAFINKDPSRVNSAIELRNKFIKYFNLTNVKQCDSTLGFTGDLRFCAFETEFYPRETSPWISGTWVMMIPVDKFSETVQWISQNRGDLDLIVHPNTGYPDIDHQSWSLRAGLNWPLTYGPYTK